MNKKAILPILALLIVLALGIYAHSEHNSGQAGDENGGTATSTTDKAFEPLNATYIVEDESVVLVNGNASTEAAPGSASKIVTKIFGQPVSGDLNGDGKADAAMFIQQNGGGTGTFYYAAVAIATKDGAKGTNAVFLGDRIAPQTIEIRNGQVIANYADRKPNEPFAAEPSVAMSKYLMLDGATLVLATPQRATLTGEYVCLPHKNTSGPQTLECALGMKLDDGSYYGLDFNLMSQTPPTLKTGDRFTASGAITPIENLSSDYWTTNYNIKGIFSVTNGFQKL